MNLIWLEDFLALAASGNFSRAAAERHMTQPAFSRRIRALEDWLGVPLFDRSSQPAALTETGEWFRSVAQDLLDRVDRVPEQARAISEAGAATLRFACTHSLSFTFLPLWLRSLESGMAPGPMQLVSDVMQQCETLLQQGRVQFLLGHWHAQVAGRLASSEHPSVQVGIDMLLPVCAADKTGQPLHRLSIKNQAAVPLLAYSAESGIGRIVRSLRGAALGQACGEVLFTAHLASVLKSMALDGRGIAWLPTSLIADELKNTRLVAAGDDTWAIPLEIRLFRSQATLPAAAETFWRQASCSTPVNT
jgi:DNA-binding transcriptional LysR family regulator